MLEGCVKQKGRTRGGRTLSPSIYSEYGRPQDQTSSDEPQSNGREAGTILLITVKTAPY